MRGKPLHFGEMAVQLGFMTDQQLQKALEIQTEIAVALDSPKRLGFYLLEAGVVTPTQLRVALADQKGTGMPLGQVLVAQGAIDHSLLETMLQVQRMERITSFAREMAG
ncbi:bacteriophage N4 adsorption protein B [compost metagenome]